MLGSMRLTGRTFLQNLAQPLPENSYVAGGGDSVSVGADLRVRPE